MSRFIGVLLGALFPPLGVWMVVGFGAGFWINLLLNARDAMLERNVLEISSRRDGDIISGDPRAQVVDGMISRPGMVRVYYGGGGLASLSVVQNHSLDRGKLGRGGGLASLAVVQNHSIDRGKDRKSGGLG